MDDSIRNRFQLRAERPRTVLTLFTRATSHARAAVSVDGLSSSSETSEPNLVFREFISSKGRDPTRRQRILRRPPFFGGWLVDRAEVGQLQYPLLRASQLSQRQPRRLLLFSPTDHCVRTQNKPRIASPACASLPRSPTSPWPKRRR